MDCEREFFLCPKCFHVADVSQEHHLRRMFHYVGFQAGHEQLGPIQDNSGNLKGRAPRWFVEKQWPHAVRSPAPSE